VSARAALLFLLSSCVSDADVQAALQSFCDQSDGLACQKAADCCPGFACAAGQCLRLVEGQCLFTPDAGGVQPLGAGCGCSSDCARGACTALKCQ
jgi:hypothetical protein